MFAVSEYNNTRGGRAIKNGAEIRKFFGVPTIKIEPLQTRADGLCCGRPYETEYLCSAGASVHVWFDSEPDTERMERLVKTLIYWKDVFIMTWSIGEPAGYRAHFKLEEKRAA